MDENGKKIVLIVDDSASIRAEVKVVLQKEGYVVRGVGGEIGMLNAIEEYGVMADLILMDLTLNNTDGFNLISIIRESKKYAQIPIIILTEHADRRNVETARNLDVHGYIVKPIQPELLKERVSNVLSKESNNENKEEVKESE